MYLLPTRSPSLLGAYRRVSAVPVLPQQRVHAQPPRFRIGTRPVIRRFGLGQDATAVLTYPPADSTPPDIAVSPPMSAQISAAVANIPESVPAPPSGYPPLPAQIRASYTSQPMNLDPLNFVSPQAAIAAGADPQKTAAAWTKAVASFPTQQAALAAGIPAGVVTQLWAASRSAAAGAPGGSWLDGSTFGIPNKYLAFGVGGIALLAAMRGKGRR